MRVHELDYACRLYGQLADYDDSLKRFRDGVAPAVDPVRPDHRARLFTLSVRLS